MSRTAAAQQAKTATLTRPPQGLLQRKCDCGNHTVSGGECEECAKKKRGLQPKLAVGSSDDPFEREADRVADQVMAVPTPCGGNAIPRIRRLAQAADGGMETAPASVERVLAGSGRPLDQALRRDMGRRFGYDFSRVRVHTGADAARSARDVNAHAYTVGHDIVFGAGRFAPESDESKRLIAHELTHVVQQETAAGFGLAPNTRRGAVPDHSFNPVRRVQREDDPVSQPGSQPRPESDLGEFGPYHGCGGYREQVENARAEAARIVGQARAVLDEPGMERSAPLLERHFHLDARREENRPDLQRIRDQFARMESGLNSGIRVFCRSAPSPGGGVRPSLPVNEACANQGARSSACANNDPSSTVTLCESSLLELNHPLVKTLIHEFAHIACNADLPITSGGTGGGEVYYSSGERLPGERANVLNQADSYAWFAMDAASAAGGTRPAAEERAGGPDRTGWGVLTALGAGAAIAGGIALGLGVSGGNDVAIGLGIAGLGLGAVGLGVGIAGLAGAFDPRRPPRQTAAPVAGARTAPPSLAELTSMSAWQLGQLPETAFAAAASAGQAPAAGPQLADFARAWRVVRCIRDFHGLRVDPQTTERLGREPNDREWPIIRRTLSQILSHSNVGGLVSGPGGRGSLGEPALAHQVRIVDRIGWGVKRFQLESLITPVGAGADRLVRAWWAEPRCGVQALPSAQVTVQERQMAFLHEKVMEGGLGEGGFYLPPDDAVYIQEALAARLVGTGSEAEGARATVGHEMVHLLGGREGTRQAFQRHFPGETWICYWSAFEEGMAELTTRDALALQQPGRGYEPYVQLMREIMQALGEDRVRRAYFTGAPDRDIFEAVRQGLPRHRDPSLPPVCQNL